MNKLRRFCLVFLIIVFTTINLELVKAYFYNISYTCKDNACIEGDKALWYVTISNKGVSEVEYIAIELLNVMNNTAFTSLNIPFYPVSDNRGNLIVVKSNEQVTVNLTGRLPKANYGDLLIYYPCFATTITDSYIIARENRYESRQCYKQNESMQILQCVSNNNCNINEFCSFNKCLKLKCKNCQFIKEHACVDYECCGSEQCKFDELCKNNTCQKLNCEFNEYILNNTCNILNCAFDEFIFNKTCNKLNCSYDESVFNSTCKKLNCSGNEFIQNRTCKLLECKKNEYAKNHVCNPLECLYNESIVNHACKPLNCYFFQDNANHSCINNKSTIFKSLMEIIVIFFIILFFILDFRKYEKKHHVEQENSEINTNKKLDLKKCHPIVL